MVLKNINAAVRVAWSANPIPQSSYSAGEAISGLTLALPGSPIAYSSISEARSLQTKVNRFGNLVPHGNKQYVDTIDATASPLIIAGDDYFFAAGDAHNPIGLKTFWWGEPTSNPPAVNWATLPLAAAQGNRNLVWWRQGSFATEYLIGPIVPPGRVGWIGVGQLPDPNIVWRNDYSISIPGPRKLQALVAMHLPPTGWPGPPLMTVKIGAYTFSSMAAGVGGSTDGCVVMATVDVPSSGATMTVDANPYPASGATGVDPLDGIWLWDLA